MLFLTIMSGIAFVSTNAQELQAKFNVNHAQIQGTETAVFDRFKEVMEQFVNERKWTSLNFQQNERIQCSFNITVKKYDPSTNMWTCTAIIQANRPVYNSAYNSTFYNNTDNEFSFTYSQFDQIEFNEDIIDNSLTAIIAYYAYLIIGWNLDTFSLNGGEEILQKCMNLTNNAQNLDYPGWKAFDSSRNRFAIINDYLEGAMAPFRKLQYDYYRKGLDEMTNNTERGRIEITTAIEEDLQKAHEDRPLSLLPQIWTDFKKEEIANIYKGKGTQKEKESVYNILFKINASQNNTWEKIKQ